MLSALAVLVALASTVFVLLWRPISLKFAGIPVAEYLEWTPLILLLPLGALHAWLWRSLTNAETREWFGLRTQPGRTRLNRSAE